MSNLSISDFWLEGFSEVQHPRIGVPFEEHLFCISQGEWHAPEK